MSVRSEPDTGERGRAEFYHLLGVVLAKPPDDEVLAVLGAINPGNEAPETPITTALQQLRSAAEIASRQQVKDEYFKLFIGLGRGEVAPYASWYLTGLLMDKPLAALRGELKRLGFERRDEVAEPEDHAAALCEVMGMIILENALQLNEQRAFFQAYIGSWMDRFFADLGQAEAADFYKAVAQVGRQFMEIETQYFSLPV